MGSSAAATVLSCLLALTLTSTSSTTSASKLNVPRVLLPFSEEGTSFVLFADQKEKGCFKWKSSRPEVSHSPRTSINPDILN